MDLKPIRTKKDLRMALRESMNSSMPSRERRTCRPQGSVTFSNAIHVVTRHPLGQNRLGAEKEEYRKIRLKLKRIDYTHEHVYIYMI